MTDQLTTRIKTEDFNLPLAPSTLIKLPFHLPPCPQLPSLVEPLKEPKLELIKKLVKLIELRNEVRKRPRGRGERNRMIVNGGGGVVGVDHLMLERGREKERVGVVVVEGGREKATEIESGDGIDSFHLFFLFLSGVLLSGAYMTSM
jgi:hypothetical protein